LVWPETLFHRTTDPDHKAMVLAVGACLFVIIFHFLLNELLGLDKIGSFYFICIALLVKLDSWIKSEVSLPKINK
jgi:hypothetical protein